MTLYWASTAEDIDLGIKHGFTTMEKVEAVLAEWKDFMEKLEQEWPPERLKEWINAYYVNRYKSTQEFIEKLETKNRDDRVRGVSFKDREPLSKKISVGGKVLADIKAQAEQAKKYNYNVHNFVELVDMPYVKARGFEAQLKHWYWY